MSILRHNDVGCSRDRVSARNARYLRFTGRERRAETRVRPQSDPRLESNVTVTLNDLKGYRHNGVEYLVCASTSSVYGANTNMPFSVLQRAYPDAEIANRESATTTGTSASASRCHQAPLSFGGRWHPSATIPALAVPQARLAGTSDMTGMGLT